MILGLLAMAAASCRPTAEETPPTVSAAPATPVPTPTPVPPLPEDAASAFLQAWEQRDYETMHGLLSPQSREVLTLESFARRYENALTTASVLTVTTNLQSVLRQGDRAAAAFDVTLETALFGTLSSEGVMAIAQTGISWGVDWKAGLIWPQLAEDEYFRTTYSIPIRADIYDTNGLGLATQGTIVTLGVIPAQIEDEEALLQALSSVTGLPPDAIRERYASTNPEWKVPIADIPAAVSVEQNDILASLPGLYREEKTGRLYPRGEAAPHVVGWVAPVPAEEGSGRIVQGFLESSNVSPVSEVARMIEVQRTYELGQGFLDREDERIRAVIRTFAR